MEDVSIWLRGFMNEFRKKSKKLSKEERLKISNLDDFFSPCQLLFLWPKDVDFQYLLCLHDENREDKEVEVVGPFPTYEAIDRLDSILKDPKYCRQLSKEEKELVFGNKISFANILEGVFLGFLQEIRNRPFQRPPQTSLIGMKLWVTSRSFLWKIDGNIAELPYARVVSDIIDNARKAAKQEQPPSAPQVPKPKIKSCATYFYPPIWVGKLPKKTFQEKARGAFTFPKKVVDLKYKDRVVVVNQDGLVAIGEENTQKSARMLNEVMAASLLIGIEASAVREVEVCNAEIDPSSSTIAGWGIRTFTLRTHSSIGNRYSWKAELKLKRDLF